MLKSIAQVKTFVNEVANAESTAHILSNRGRNMCPLLTFVIMKFFLCQAGLAGPALTGQKQLIIRIIVLQKIFPTANGSVPNPVGGQSIFS